MLDSKITNVNACINSLSNAESKLNEMEQALDKRLRDEENDDISELSVNERADMSDTNNAWNMPNVDNKLTNLYKHISEIPVIDQKNHIKMIDRDIKSRLSSNFSRKLMQSKSKSNRSYDVHSKYQYKASGCQVHDALGRHKNWCGSVKNQISNLLN